MTDLLSLVQQALWPSLAAPVLWGMLALAVVTWLVSVPLRDASLADRIWPLFFVLAVAAPWLLHPAEVMGSTGALRAWATTALAVAWGARLGLYITHRNWGHGEDRRYQAIRARNQPGFAVKSLYLVFGLQAALAWWVALPLHTALGSATAWGLLDTVGLALGTAGLLCEAVADAQMARFQADPHTRHEVMNRGLWGWSRHPNYFGEACVWWGLWLMALSAAPTVALWQLGSPLLMTFLLLKVSGVALLEQDIGSRRPGYAQYVQNTPAFFPRPPRRAAADAKVSAAVHPNPRQARKRDA